MPDEEFELKQRVSIAIDVASALDYLHHHSPVPIVHCDLKPNNILQDDDMTAHVSDFGLAKFLSESTDSFSISASLGGNKRISWIYCSRVQFGKQSINSRRCVQLWNPSLGDVYWKEAY